MQIRMYRCNDESFVTNQFCPSIEQLAEIFRDHYYPRGLENGLDTLKEIEKGAYRPVPTSSDLPVGLSLQDKMPPVYDQYARGTCVAQAATALMEYFCDCKFRFSMQYLFERIKRLEKEKYEQAALELINGNGISDPHVAKVAAFVRAQLREEQKEATPENVAKMLYNKKVSLSNGSLGYMAMEVLSKWGICTYEKWPYSRQILEMTADVDATRPDVPPGADAEAAFHRLTAQSYVFPAPTNVEEIKRYLVGTYEHRPMPVMIGVFTLDNLEIEGDVIRIPKVKYWQIESILCDVAVEKDADGDVVNLEVTGIDKASLKEEDPIPAMDMRLTGGHEMLIVGYQDDESFAGGGYFIVRNSWHKDWGQEGYCKMPYAFAELFIDEAVTIVQPMKVYSGSNTYATAATTTVTMEVPEDMKEYVVTADREQKDRHGRWTIAKGSLVIIDKAGVTDRYTEQNAMIFRRQGFSWTPSVENTAENSKGTSAEATPAQPVLTPMEERFFSGLEAAFRQMPLPFPQLGGLRKGWFSGTGKATAFNRIADLSARAGNPLKLYSVSGPKSTFRIAAMYLKDADGADGFVGKVRALLEEYNAQHPFEPCACTIFVIGCNESIATSVQPYVSESEVRVVLDNYTVETGWRIGVEALAGDDAWPEWLLRLIPNTPAQWGAQLELAYETVVATGGHVTISKVAKAAGFCEELVSVAINRFAHDFQIKGDMVAKR